MGSLFWTPRRMKRCLARDFYAATRSCHGRHLFARTRSGRPLLRASHFTSTCMYNTQYPIYCSLIISLSNLRTMSPQSQRLHVRAPKASHSKWAPSRLPSSCIKTAGARMLTLTFRMQEGMMSTGRACPVVAAVSRD